MKLSEAQNLFAQLFPSLLTYANNLADENGWLITIGDVFRDPRVHGVYGEKKSYASSKSNHKLKLAIDINIIDRMNNKLLGAEAHKPLGEFWKNLHELCEWGGDPDRYDANHYSLRYWGRW